jgi:hypothetical protein
MVPLYYKPSGKFTVAGIALGLAGGILAGLVLAFVYSYIIAYIPFIYLNALCAIGFGIALGFAVGFILKWGRVRSSVISIAVALVAGLISLYFSWAVWMSVLLGKADINVGVLEFALQPDMLWGAINRVNEVGPWKIGSSTVSGGFLWLVWAIEAAIILGATILTAVATASATPFCEACQSWCDKTDRLMLVADAEADELKRRMEAKDFDYLKRLGAKPDSQREWVNVSICHCPACGQTNTLTVRRERLTIDKKGKAETKATMVVDNLLLNKDDVHRLRQISQELSIVQPPPQQSSPAT